MNKLNRRRFMEAVSASAAALAVSSVARFARGQDSAAPDAKPVRVLLTYGGHGFQQKPFFEMFDKMPGIEVERAPMPQSVDLLKPGLQEKIDVIVMYDMVGSITPEQQQAFVALLKQGIGLISLHHNMGAHRDWDEFTKIIGGKYVFKPCTIDDKEQGKSNYAHGQDVDVKVADRTHPITKGIEDFQIHDETYGNTYTSPDVKVLLTTDHPKNDPEVAWVKRYGKSPVFYLILGHDAKAWANPVFPQLLLNGIRWAHAEVRA